MVDRWILSPPDEDIGIQVGKGFVLIDVPGMSVSSKFEVKGSNVAAGIRGPGPTVAAIAADGSVFVQTGTMVCVSISATAKAAILKAGQMFDPVTQVPKPIPASSNMIWNLLSK